MVWRGNNAVVANVYLDKDNQTGISETESVKLIIYSQENGFKIHSEESIGKIEVYSLSGLKMYETEASDCSIFISMPPGSYIVKVSGASNGMITRKVMVLN